MKKKGNYMAERLKKNNQNKVVQGRVAIFLCGIFLLIVGVYSATMISMVVSMLHLLMILLGGCLLFLGYWSLKKPVQAFKAAFIPIILLALIFFGLLPIILLGIVGWSVYQGLEGAKGLQSSFSGKDLDVLDSDEVS